LNTHDHCLSRDSEGDSDSNSAVAVSTAAGGGANANIIGFCDANVDFCASYFYSYSIDELRCLDKQTLHSLLSSSSFQIATEDDFLRSLISLGSDYYEFWNYVEVLLLTKDGLSIFVEKLPFDKLTLDIWSKIIQRLCEVRQTDLHYRHYFEYGLPMKSAILTTFPKIINEFHNKKWDLLYSGRTDGFGTSDFHKKMG
jgi:hypothetical protein